MTAAVSMAACSDFLEPNSKSEFVPKDAVSLNELLLGEAYLRNDKTGFNIFLGLLDDDIEATPYQDPAKNFEEDKFLASFAWQPKMFEMMEKANSGHINIYERYYELILGANAVLDYLPEITDTQDNINIVKAQAYALRGFYYFNLVNIFGAPYNSDSTALGVPLKLQSGIEASDDYLKRKTVAEVYAQILSDLHAAEDTYLQLPESQRWKANSYRTNLPMVQLMLSRTYLYMENWKKASAYADSVMKHPGLKLVDLNNVSTEGYDDNGKEIRNYLVYPTTKSSETIWSYGNVEDMFKWTCEGINSENSKGDTLHAYFQASKELKDLFDDFDLRKERYIVKTPQDSLRMMPFGKVVIGTTYYLPKHGEGVFGRSLRLSEAYLNYAEAEARLGGDGIAKAADVLTKLRERRCDVEFDYEVSITDADELIEFIKEERRRELCFEGHRWFDLRRWGMPEIKHIWHKSKTESLEYTLAEGDLMYTIPIPDEALEENPKLEQNELPGERTYQTITKQ